MVDIVTLSDQEMYVVDVGYGGDGAIRPLPLVEGTITPNIGRQEMRLTKDHKGPLVRQSNDLWTYQIRNGTDKPWQTNYVFTEIEFTPQDFRIMSYFTSTHPDSYMVNTLVAVKMLMNDEGEIYGKLMLAGADLKRNTGGRTETLLTCKTEGERVAVLEEHFGIKLSQEERDAIHGSKTRID
jgi:arylamine N-acetyltransferase